MGGGKSGHDDDEVRKNGEEGSGGEKREEIGAWCSAGVDSIEGCCMVRDGNGG